MAALNTGGAAARVEKIPQVASANVSRTGRARSSSPSPSGQPPRSFPDAQGYEVVDGGGVVFGQVSKATKGLPVITVSAPAKADQVVPGALAALRALPASVSAPDLRDHRVRSICHHTAIH